MKIQDVAKRVFIMYRESSDQIFTDAEYFENLSAEFPQLSSGDILQGINMGKKKIKEHEYLKNTRENQ